MEGQGFGVIRTDDGRVYAALDYGHSGGSHGHPDRLNLWLVLGDQRVFEDVGTGSYVERTLHWYRSTLAHNAPLIDGRSQDAVSGSLRAWDHQGGLSWIDAEAPVASGVLVRRSVVVGDTYLIDRVEWIADRDVTFDLPMHIEGDVDGAMWHPKQLTGNSGLEDGFDFVTTAESAPGSASARVAGAGVQGTVLVDGPCEWWRARAPGPPMNPERAFLMVRSVGRKGLVTSVWSWAAACDVRGSADGSIEVSTGGVRSRHQLVGDAWHVESSDANRVILGGQRRTEQSTESFMEEHLVALVFIPILRRDVSIGDLLTSGTGLRFELGRSQYRRTEATWEEAGSPMATVLIAATASEILVEVSVKSAREPNFVPTQPSNGLDNEHPDTNSDGVQLHLRFLGDDTRTVIASWLMVPVPDSPAVRVTGRDDASRVPMTATWQRTRRGWQVLARIRRDAIGSVDAPFALDVIVNEMPSTRERRRGQLVMSATQPGWAYLRGDRQESDQLIAMAVRNG
jgi:hypothetical protein